MNVYEKKIAELERANAELRKKIISAEKYDEGGSKMKINDEMIIKCNNAKEYSWLINELDKEDIFIFAIDPEHCMGKPKRLNGREVNWDNKSYEKWFHDRRYFSIRSDFKLVHVMYQNEALGLKLMANYPIIEAKRLMEEKEMKENVKYTDVYKKEVKCLVRTDVIPWENCGVIGTIPYKEAITDVEGTVLKVGDYVEVVDIGDGRSRTITSIMVDNGNRLVPYCNKDYDADKGVDREHDILLIKVGEFPIYSNTMDPETKEPSFVLMGQHEFDKQDLAYYKAQYENTLSKLEVLQTQYNSIENTNELLKRKIEKLMKQEKNKDEN